MVRKNKREELKNDQFGLESYRQDIKHERQLVRRIRRVVLTLILAVVTFAAQEFDLWAHASHAISSATSQAAP